MAEHWDIFLKLLTYAYSMEVNRSTRKTTFSLELSRHLPGPTTFDRPFALLTEANDLTAPSLLSSKLLHRIAVKWEKTGKKLTNAAARVQISS